LADGITAHFSTAVLLRPVGGIDGKIGCAHRLGLQVIDK
jgi:hypothetical protein